MAPRERVHLARQRVVRGDVVSPTVAVHARAGVVGCGVVAFHADWEVEDAAGADADVGEHGARVGGHAVEGGGGAERRERVLAVRAGFEFDAGGVRAAEDGGDDVGAVSVAVLGVAEGGDVGVDFAVVGAGGRPRGSRRKHDSRLRPESPTPTSWPAPRRPAAHRGCAAPSRAAPPPARGGSIPRPVWITADVSMFARRRGVRVWRRRGAGDPGAGDPGVGCEGPPTAPFGTPSDANAHANANASANTHRARVVAMPATRGRRARVSRKTPPEGARGNRHEVHPKP